MSNQPGCPTKSKLFAIISHILYLFMIYYIVENQKYNYTVFCYCKSRHIDRGRVICPTTMINPIKSTPVSHSVNFYLYNFSYFLFSCHIFPIKESMYVVENQDNYNNPFFVTVNEEISIHNLI